MTSVASSDSATLVSDDCHSPTIEQQEEAEAAHQALQNYLQHETVDEASSTLRIELLEFIETSDMTLASQAERDDDERSDRSTGSSVRFLVATPVKDIPSEWKRLLPLTSTPRLHTQTIPPPIMRHDITKSTGATAPQSAAGLNSLDTTCSTGVSAPRPAKRTRIAIAAPEGTLTSPTMMLLRSPTPKDGIKLFKQINGSGKAVLYPFHQADDGSKKAILTLLTTDSAPRQPSAAQAADTPAETHRTAADVLQAIQISQPAAIVPQKRKLSIIPHKLPYAAVAAIKPIPQPDYTKPTILRLTNVPWTITVDELIEWLGIENHMLPYSVQIISVHILCDRQKGRTKAPCFVEMTDAKVAHDIVVKKGMTLLRHRQIKITIGTMKELLTAMFPAWAQASPALMYKPATVILTTEEIEGLKKLCTLQASFIKQTPERPFMHILSIAAKYPWRDRDTLLTQGDEQSKAMQLVRDGYKALNQYGKRLPNYAKIKKAFATFLNAHGGLSGSLRAIPVDEAVCPPASSASSTSSPPKSRPVIYEGADPIAPLASAPISSGTSSTQTADAALSRTPPYTPQETININHALKQILQSMNRSNESEPVTLSTATSYATLTSEKPASTAETSGGSLETAKSALDASAPKFRPAHPYPAGFVSAQDIKANAKLTEDTLRSLSEQQDSPAQLPRAVASQTSTHVTADKDAAPATSDQSKTMRPAYQLNLPVQKPQRKFRQAGSPTADRGETATAKIIFRSGQDITPQASMISVVSSTTSSSPPVIIEKPSRPDKLFTPQASPKKPNETLQLRNSKLKPQAHTFASPEPNPPKAVEKDRVETEDTTLVEANEAMMHSPGSADFISPKRADEAPASDTVDLNQIVQDMGIDKQAVLHLLQAFRNVAK